MFSGNTISLNELIDGKSDTMIRDRNFSHPRKIPSRLEKRIVPCGSVKHIRDAISHSEIVGILTIPELEQEVPEHLGLAVSTNPVALAYSLHEILCQRNLPRNDFETRIDPIAELASGVFIAKHNVHIDAGCIIHTGAIILPRSIIGPNCSVGPSNVVEADAFEIKTKIEPHRILMLASGVLLEENVAIQAKCTIVRLTFGGFTTIGRDSKLNCQIYVAQDCKIGLRVRMAACAEISDWVTVGGDVFLGPNCFILNGVEIGNHARVTVGAVVTRNVEDGQRVSGNFAIDHRQHIKHMKSIRYMIPFADLAAQQDRLRNEIEACIKIVLAHGEFILGLEVKEGILQETIDAVAECISNDFRQGQLS